jgi:hypothetical protein
MNRYLTAIAFLIAGFGLLVGGCGSDDSSSGNLQTGDPSDQSFMFVEEYVGEEVLGSFQSSLDMSFELIDSIPGITASSRFASPGGTGAAGDGFTFTSIDSLVIRDNWFVFWFEAVIEDIEDTTWIAGVDSIQFQINGDPVDPRQTADYNGILARAHVIVESTSAFAIAAHHRMDVHTVPGALNLILIDGTAVDSIYAGFEDQTTVCSFDFANNVEIDGLTISEDPVTGECPSAGRVTSVSTLALECSGQGGSSFEQLDVNGTWTIIAVANGDGTVTITYSDGHTVWTVTEDYCGEDPPTGV